MKPRILVLTSTFPRTENNKEPRFIADLCSELTDSFDITVLSQHRPGASIQEKRGGYDVLRFRYAPESFELLSENGGFTASLKQNRLLWMLIPVFFVSQILSIRRLLKSGSYSAVHAHWLIPQGFAAVVANKTLNKPTPVICTGHGADVFGLQGNLLNKLKRWVINKSSAVSVVSRSMKEYLESELQIAPEKISVIPMGTDLTKIFVPKNIERVPGQIAFAGRLVEKKGLKHLIQIIPSLAYEVEHLRLVIAGTGPERKSLEKQVGELHIDEYVDFVGSQDHLGIANLFARSQLCVFPFIQASGGDMEGFGLVTVEAMGCKCPVIVGDVPAVRDIVLNMHTGVICDPRNTEQLKVGIVNLLKNEELRNQLAESAYHRVHQNFSWEIIGKQYAELLASNSQE
jgi:glycosyltransferase involved in cell wall biosynthesis